MLNATEIVHCLSWRGRRPLAASPRLKFCQNYTGFLCEFSCQNRCSRNLARVQRGLAGGAPEIFHRVKLGAPEIFLKKLLKLIEKAYLFET